MQVGAGLTIMCKININNEICFIVILQLKFGLQKGQILERKPLCFQMFKKSSLKDMFKKTVTYLLDCCYRHSSFY